MPIVAHIDMDAFFAAIEERDRCWLSGKPVVIGADPEGGFGRGVVSTANYPARAYGIRSAMPIGQAWKRSEWAQKQGKPAAFFLTPDGEKYKRISREIVALLKEFGSVEQASIDEAYLDVSHTRSYKRARETAEKIKKDIKRKHRLTTSIGIGPNKLVAKIASDQNKPNGLTLVTPAKIQSFIDTHTVETLPGVGPRTLRTLHKAHVHSVGDLARQPHRTLRALFGVHGDELYDKARGQGATHITPEPVKPQSIGEQETYAVDTLDTHTVFSSIQSIAEGIMQQVRKKEIFGFRHVSVMVRFTDFQTYSRSHTMPMYVCSGEDIFREATQLILPFLDGRENKSRKPIRLVGVRVEQLI